MRGKVVLRLRAATRGLVAVKQPQHVGERARRNADLAHTLQREGIGLHFELARIPRLQ